MSFIAKQVGALPHHLANFISPMYRASLCYKTQYLFT